LSSRQNSLFAVSAMGPPKIIRHANCLMRKFA